MTFIKDQLFDPEVLSARASFMQLINKSTLPKIRQTFFLSAVDLIPNALTLIFVHHVKTFSVSPLYHFLVTSLEDSIPLIMHFASFRCDG